MKSPHHIGAVCIAMALAACSGAQTGVSPNTLPAADAPQTSPLFRAHKATTALMLVANEGAGMGGSILEFPEAANGNVAPSSVIAKNRGIPGPFAVGFNSTQGIAIADGKLTLGLSADSAEPVQAQDAVLTASDDPAGSEPRRVFDRHKLRSL